MKTEKEINQIIKDLGMPEYVDIHFLLTAVCALADGRLMVKYKPEGTTRLFTQEEVRFELVKARTYIFKILLSLDIDISQPIKTTKTKRRTKTSKL
jgi:hypothetical protein